jgi:cytochrome c553
MMSFLDRGRFAAILGAAVLAWWLLWPAGRFAAAGPDPASPYTPGPMLSRFLQGPLAGVDEIVFAARPHGRDPHWYVTFANYADRSAEPQRYTFGPDRDGVLLCYGEGGRLCRLNLRTGKLTILLEDRRGGIRDPQVHYDGRKILFSYRPSGETAYHLYEINVDGTGLRQLTDGPDDDIEPTYCPDGNIVFCSARCRRFVNCWYTRVATLYRCDGDGKNIRMLSSNLDHDNTPWMLPDGRILYMRWEYVDRSQVHFHHLWTMNPDGTGQMVYFGNMYGGIVMIDAKPIPGTRKVVASFSPGHGQTDHDGYVTIVDPRLGPDVPSMAVNLTKTPTFRDPYAVSQDCFLVASSRGIHVMDGAGNDELIYQLPPSDRYLQCHEPRPLKARGREPVIPPRTDLANPNGRLILEDIYRGRNMVGVEPGEIKKLLVLEQVPKPVNFSGGMEPLTIGGTFTLARIVGTVPVEPDGSAHMELPALRSLFFVALDRHDIAVKRMHSFVTLQPGETTSCVGCHEQRRGTPHPIRSDLAALRRRPSQVEPISDVPPVLDFPRDIQPILDKHCVECHNPDRWEGQVDLTGDKTAMYTMSYWTMQTRGLVSDGRNEPRGNRPPHSEGSAASRLMTLIDGSHYGAQPSDHEVKVIRLWIETSATYPGTYAALGCGSYPVFLPRAAIVQRCGACHGEGTTDPQRRGGMLHFPGGWGNRPEPLMNLSRPEKSYLLRAPLAKQSGGLALCKETVFADTGDPLYRQMLSAIQDAHERLLAGKRFDMPGFRPNEHYIREMQRFGFLPADLKPDDPIDVYAVDRAYWDSFHYRP